MNSPEQSLKELDIDLPGLLPAAGTYVAAKRHNDLVYVSGHGPLALSRLPANSGEPYAVDAVLGALIQGKVGSDLSLQEAKDAARSVGLLLLSTLRNELGSLDKVRSVLKVFGMVNCTPDFMGAAAVIDGCSELLIDVFGDEVGRHARSAPGMAVLPFNVPVVIEMVVATDPQPHSQR